MLAELVHDVLGRPDGLAVEAFDGSRAGPVGNAPTLVVRSPDAIARVVTRPGELGLARAWVAGDLDVRGELFTAIEALEHFEEARVSPATALSLLRATGAGSLRRLPPPPEEAALRGRRHSKARDRHAVTHHYDVSNDFYRLVLGPSMTYSCAVFPRADATLEEAQETKYELICAKLGLRAGHRLLDVGCGWGGMVLHAARHHGVVAVGITLSQAQAELARQRVAEEGLDGKVEIRVQDYRDVHDGPFDAISSIGMFEHVGRAGVGAYTRALHELVHPGGRVLNHAISRPAIPAADGAVGQAIGTARRLGEALGSNQSTRIHSQFMDRYVFPDGELFEVGSAVSHLQQAGLEARHVETLREHYARTLRAWVANLQEHWDEAVEEVGERRARVWLLYMAMSARGFERARLAVHQVLAVRPHADGASDLPLRPDW